MSDASIVPPLSEAAALDVIRRLTTELGSVDAHGRPRIVLVGGQAVLLWQDLLGFDVAGEAFVETTDDIDFVVRERSVMEACARALGGTLLVPEPDHQTPNLGVVEYRDLDGVARRLDFLVSPIGLDAEEVMARAVPTTFGASDVVLYVMHPEDMLRGSIAKLLRLRVDEVSVRQVRSAIVSTREFARLLLDSRDVPDRVRVVLQGNQRIYVFAKSPSARDLHLRFGVEVLDAILEDHDALPVEFRTEFLPRVQAEIRVRRARQAAHAAEGERRIGGA